MSGTVVQPVDWVATAPPLAAAGAAILVLLVDLVVGPRIRAVLGWLALAGLLVSALMLLPLVHGHRRTFCFAGTKEFFPTCSYTVDAVTLAFQAVTVLAAAVVVLLSIRTVDDDHLPGAEYWFLLLSSVSGALVLAAARDLVTLLIALEVVTLPTYVLVGMRRHDRRSSEAAVKLFLVSVVSTAVTLYGIALVYGVTGQLLLDRVATVLATPGEGRAVAGVGVLLTLAGFSFKVAAVPFHFWAPDTYTGAPVPIAAYLSVVSKAAGFVGLVLVLTVGFPAFAYLWAPVVAVIAALTMSLGNLVALRQRHAIRLLAWSSVAQSGYILLPLGTADADANRAVSATVAYLLAYAVMNLLAFGAVVILGRHRPRQRLEDYRGLWRTEPLTAAALAFALLCLAGLPPGLLGLFAKVVVFEAPVAAGRGWLAVVMAVNVAVGLAYYLRWGVLLVSPPADGHRPPSYRIAVPDGVALGLALGAAVAFSAAPSVLIDVLTRGATILG